MARPRVLITGGTGLLALNWACAVRETSDVVLVTHRRDVSLRGASSLRLSLENLESLTAELQRLKPDVVVHTAGMTSVEDCEREPEVARDAHERLSRNVAAASAAAGARLIHISTDHLFAGTHALSPEDAPPQPLNAYGETKLLAERAVAEADPQALVVRTNFFGWGHRYRRSFSDWIFYALREGRELTMFDDVFVTPILADSLAHVAHRLLERGARGPYNVVGDERISKYELGLRLATVFELPERLVRRGKIAASQLSVKRPPDMSLDNRKARALLGSSLGSVDEFLRLLREQERDGRRVELESAVTE